jgi:hypothetical protein
MHSYTSEPSEAAIAAKTLRISGGTPKKLAFSSAFDHQQLLERSPAARVALSTTGGGGSSWAAC